MRSLNRALTRYTTRMLNGASRPSPPNYLAHALLALRRANRARRQLNRLAPHLFDVGVIQHAERERQRAEQEARPWQQAIAKVYGVPEADVIASWP
jgi:uncharacterized protein YjiS (DUF1127 family)